MLRTLMALVVAMSFALPIRAGADEAAIRSVIDRQIEAFRGDDFAAAFEFASPSIQGIFQSPERFGQMVRNGYPMVWRPSELQYLELREIAGRLYQRVMITDAAGALHMLDYQMIETDAGWQINGVQLLPAPEVGA